MINLVRSTNTKKVKRVVILTQRKYKRMKAVERWMAVQARNMLCQYNVFYGHSIVALILLINIYSLVGIKLN